MAREAEQCGCASVLLDQGPDAVGAGRRPAFPLDLCARATYERSLMGSLTKTIVFEDSPGYTAEEITLVRSLRQRLVRLSAAVITDPWWAIVPAGELVDARMTLTRLHPQPEKEGSGHSAVEKAA